jgi:cytochrome c oxidase cbb3-type subunit 3
MATDENKNINLHNQEDYEYDTLTNDRLIKGHDYDGIKELDNDLPPWWVWLFYITIAFAIIYSIRLFVFQADDLVQAKEFEKEMTEYHEANAAAEAETQSFEIKLLTDNASLEEGKKTWMGICAACHLQDGGGLVGPNMTDDYWIHGNTVEDLYNVVTNGVIEKGMLSYKQQLSEKQRLEVVSYILVKLKGTTPANPKAPQGNKY